MGPVAPACQETADWKAISLSSLQPEMKSLEACWKGLANCSLRKNLIQQVTLSVLTVLSSCLAELGTNLFFGCTNASKVYLLWYSSVVLYFKPSCSYLRPRTGRHIESILSIREGWCDPDWSWLGKGWWYPIWWSRHSPRPYLNLCSALCLAVLAPQVARRGVLLKSTAVPGCPGFPWTQAEKERRLCIPTGSQDATASLGSAARHCGFHLALQGRHQPLCMPPCALVSPPCPSFEEYLTAFCSNGYFHFVYADNHLLAPQLFYTFSLLSVLFFASSCYQLCF